MVLICPYCENELNEKQVEQEDGCCPECGAIITASTVINEDDDEYDDGYEDEYGEGEDRDDRGDEFDEFDDIDDIDDDDYR